jgi:hypothetical protein
VQGCSDDILIRTSTFSSVQSGRYGMRVAGSCNPSGQISQPASDAYEGTLFARTSFARFHFDCRHAIALSKWTTYVGSREFEC